MDLREGLSERDPDKRLVALSLLLLLVVVGAGVGTFAFTGGPDSPANETTPTPPVVEVTPVSPTPTEPGGQTATPGTPTDGPTGTSTDARTEEPSETPTDDDDSDDDSNDPGPTTTATATESRDGSRGGGGGSGEVELRTDGNSVFLQVQGVKPGDRGNGSVVFENAGSDPGRLLVSNTSVADDENGVVEPEATLGDDAADGELSDELEVRIYATYPNGSRAYFYGSDSSYVPLATIDADDAEEGDVLDGGERATVTLDWWLPASAGNEIQSDRTVFDVAFNLQST